MKAMRVPEELMHLSADEIFFPWEKEEKKRFRQAKSARQPKCARCSHHLPMGWEGSVCRTCQDRERARLRQERMERWFDRYIHEDYLP